MMDTASAQYDGPERRKEKRFTYRRSMSVRFLENSGEVRSFEAYPRNLSSLGIGCLHQPFAYPDSNVVVTLTGRDTTPIHIAGRVLACRYVGHNLHSNSILFHERIDLELFLYEAELGLGTSMLNQIRTRHDQSKRVRRKLEGLRVVLIQPEGSDLKSLTLLLKASGASVNVVDYLGNALDVLRTSGVDLLFCAAQHDGADANQIVELCRSVGYQRPIVGLSWSPATLAEADRLKDAGPLSSIDHQNTSEILAMIDEHAIELPETPED